MERQRCGQFMRKVLVTVHDDISKYMIRCNLFISYVRTGKSATLTGLMIQNRSNGYNSPIDLSSKRCLLDIGFNITPEGHNWLIEEANRLLRGIPVLTTNQ